MQPSITRRHVLLAAPAGLILAGRFTPAALAGMGPPAPVSPSYPSATMELSRRVVGLSHSKLDELKPLVNDLPTLALAAVDWGFGDWETALGAASHVGRRDIAEFLMSHGARPDVFTFAMLGNIAAVRAMIEGTPGLQRVRGPHGITLMAHAKAGGEPAQEVVAYLESLGDADEKYRDEPLDESQKRALLGLYSFGDNADEVFVVAEGMGGVTIKRGSDGPPRRLFHQGGLKFHPAGSPNVTVQFTMGEKTASSVRVNDGVIDITATGGC